MSTHTYNLKQVTFVWGPIIAHGQNDGESISITRSEDLWRMKVSGDGDATRSKSNNRSGRAVLRLAQGSDTNALLSAAQALDDAGNVGIFPIMVKDNNSTLDIAAGAKAWLTGPPAMSKGQDAGMVEWTFDISDVEIFHGGLTGA